MDAAIMNRLRRKHRLVVTLTTNKAITESAAARGMMLLLDRIDTQAKPIWAVADVYAEKLTVKRFSRVLQSMFGRGESK